MRGIGELRIVRPNAVDVGRDAREPARLGETFDEIEARIARLSRAVEIAPAAELEIETRDFAARSAFRERVEATPRCLRQRLAVHQKTSGREARSANSTSQLVDLGHPEIFCAIDDH